MNTTTSSRGKLVQKINHSNGVFTITVTPSKWFSVKFTQNNVQTNGISRVSKTSDYGVFPSMEAARARIQRITKATNNAQQQKAAQPIVSFSKKAVPTAQAVAPAINTVTPVTSVAPIKTSKMEQVKGFILANDGLDINALRVACDKKGFSRGTVTRVLKSLGLA